MLILAATPIGNLADCSDRLREVLREADIIAAEDTRVTRKLLTALNVSTNAVLVSVHEHNEREKSQMLCEKARAQNVVLVSDAGMPTVSDPGFFVVEQAVRLNIEMTVIPGPSAVVTAVALSGLPSFRFTFEGFIPKKPSERKTLFASLQHEMRTMIFFTTAMRLVTDLEQMRIIFGQDRRAAACRELTKKFEEVKRGTLQELRAWADEGIRGEIVLVVEGAKEQPTVDIDRAILQVIEIHSAGLRLKDAVAEVSELTGLSKQKLYQGALAQK